MKRSFDVILSGIGILIFLPFGLLIALFIKCDSRGPVFFKQKRVGLNGKLFDLIKFRTMKCHMTGLKITSADDPRVTRVGKYLRKWKIDEIPQLINTIKGDMSLVGPRPEVPDYIQFYDTEQLKVLSVRPGITDLASIKYRNESLLFKEVENVNEYYVNNIMPDKIKLNLEYVNGRSLFSDISLILKTIKTIVIN